MVAVEQAQWQASRAGCRRSRASPGEASLTLAGGGTSAAVYCDGASNKAKARQDGAKGLRERQLDWMDERLAGAGGLALGLEKRAALRRGSDNDDCNSNGDSATAPAGSNTNDSMDSLQPPASIVAL